MRGLRGGPGGGALPGARAVVSLDRRGKEEVIRAQLGQETASLEAASWLARRLGLGHRVSDEGPGRTPPCSPGWSPSA